MRTCAAVASSLEEAFADFFARGDFRRLGYGGQRAPPFRAQPAVFVWDSNKPVAVKFDFVDQLSPCGRVLRSSCDNTREPISTGAYQQKPAVSLLNNPGSLPSPTIEMQIKADDRRDASAFTVKNRTARSFIAAEDPSQLRWG